MCVCLLLQYYAEIDKTSHKWPENRKPKVVCKIYMYKKNWKSSNPKWFSVKFNHVTAFENKSPKGFVYLVADNKTDIGSGYV